MVCEETECDEEGAVELHIPWGENMVVCAAHARTWAQKDGVVPAPIEGREDSWP